jgi:hypothetical protein
MIRFINMISKLYDLGFHFEIIICKLNVPNEKLWYDTTWYDMIWHYLGPNKPSQWRPVLRLLDAGFSTFLKVQAAGCLAIVLVGRGLGHRGDWLMWAGCSSDSFETNFFHFKIDLVPPNLFCSQSCSSSQRAEKMICKGMVTCVGASYHVVNETR